jgi:hypothetical protein
MIATHDMISQLMRKAKIGLRNSKGTKTQIKRAGAIPVVKKSDRAFLKIAIFEDPIVTQ